MADVRQKVLQRRITNICDILYDPYHQDTLRIDKEQWQSKIDFIKCLQEPKANFNRLEFIIYCNI